MRKEIGSCAGGLCLRPDPRRTKIEAIRRRFAALVERQDAPAWSFARLEQVKIHSSHVKQSGCRQPGKSGTHNYY